MGYGISRFLMFGLLTALPVQPLIAQKRGAEALGEAVLGLGVNTRVLLIGAHPDDEDTFLIAWLSRGRHVETAYLSLTRGDGGQNLIGNELGEALGVIRTEELLAARRIDGARQYFTRAYDFGYSKSVEDTYEHWPRDSVLADVIRVVRAFRPHVIVGLFSGTPRDGHGHHQVSGLLAREAYDVAGDTVRFPASRYNAPWTPLKFYRAARFNPGAGTISLDVGEYSPLLGRSYGEIAGESRSQHKSQGFGALQRRGPLLDYLRREASRVNESTPASSERSIFDGIDTSWARFRGSVGHWNARSLDSLPDALAAVREAFDPFEPGKLIAPLVRVRYILFRICTEAGNTCGLTEHRDGRLVEKQIDPDLRASRAGALSRVDRALRLAMGVTIEASAERTDFPVGSDVRVLVSIYNRGKDTIGVVGKRMLDWRFRPDTMVSPTRWIPPAGVLHDTIAARVDSLAQPWWLAGGRHGAVFAVPASSLAENLRPFRPAVGYSVYLCSRRPFCGLLDFIEPVVHRFADQVEGEVQQLIAGAPAISVALERDVEYAPANTPLDRDVVVSLRSADDKPRDVRVTLSLPPGLAADSSARTVVLPGYDARRTVTFRVRGRLAAGEHVISAAAESGEQRFTMGYQLIHYDHIRPQRLYRDASVRITAVDVRVPSNLKVAYVPGVGDNVAPALSRLGVPTTVIPAAQFSGAELSSYTTLVIGPRAYDAHPELVASSGKILDFARGGGTVVVQYGQYEVQQPGIMPHPITIARPHDRVTNEDASVAILHPGARALRAPNRITATDFDGWVQERALYMPRTFDEHYQPLLAMNDPGEQPNRGAILVAPYGRGVYVYTTLAFFRQLPAGNPGAARLFVNLLSAGPDGQSRAAP